MARIKSKVIASMKKSTEKPPEVKVEDDSAQIETKKKRKAGKKTRARRLRKEERVLQTKTTPMVPKSTVERAVRNILSECSGNAQRCSREAFACLHWAAEEYLHEIISDAYNFSRNVGRRKTLLPEELRLVTEIHERASNRIRAVIAKT
jgi:histone H3/H4